MHEHTDGKDGDEHRRLFGQKCEHDRDDHERDNERVDVRLAELKEDVFYRALAPFSIKILVANKVVIAKPYCPTPITLPNSSLDLLPSLTCPFFNE